MDLRTMDLPQLMDMWSRFFSLWLAKWSKKDTRPQLENYLGPTYIYIKANDSVTIWNDLMGNLPQCLMPPEFLGNMATDHKILEV